VQLLSSSKLLLGQSRHISPSNHIGIGSLENVDVEVLKEKTVMMQKLQRKVQMVATGLIWVVSLKVVKNADESRSIPACNTKQQWPATAPCSCTVDMPSQLTGILWIYQTLILLLSVRCLPMP